MEFTSHLLEEAIDLAGHVKRVNGEITGAHIIYGFIKLIEMSPTYKNVLFSEEELASLDRVKQVFDENNLDYKLIREGMPLINFDEGDNAESAVEMLRSILEECVDEESVVSEIIRMNGEILKSFRIGCTLNDVIAINSTIKTKFDGTDVQRPEDSDASTGNIVSGTEPEPTVQVDPGFKTESEPDGEAAEAEIPDREEMKKKILEAIFGDQGSGKEKETDKPAWFETAEKTAVSKDSFDVVSARTRTLYKMLLGNMIGQEDAVLKFVKGYFNSNYAPAAGRKAPRGVFLLSGGQGSGKSYMASIAAKALDLPVMKLDVSTGFDPKPIESFAQANNKSIIILENLQAVDHKLLTYLTHVFRTGEMESVRDSEKMNFRDTTFIITTRIGEDIYDDPAAGRLAAIPQNLILHSMRSQVAHTLPVVEEVADLIAGNFCESLERHELIMLEKPHTRDLLSCVRDTLEELNNDISEQYGTDCLFDPQLPALILNSAPVSRDMGSVTVHTRKFIKNEFFEIADLRESDPALKNIKTVLFEVDEKGASEDIEPLFDDSITNRVLIISNEACKDLFRSDDKTEYVFASDMEETKKLLKEEISYIIIDPLYGAAGKEDAGKLLALEDSESAGLDMLAQIRDMGLKLHVYALLADDSINEIDVNYLLRSGIMGTIDASDKGSAANTLAVIAEDENLERRYKTIRKRNGYISYKSSQRIDENDDSVLHVSFYDLKFCSAMLSNGEEAFLLDSERPETRFTDVIGAENAKEELKYFISYLRDPKGFMLGGGKPPKGVLLYGPPGTGKTMLARAMAGESNVAFIQTSATKFMDKFVGESERHIRDLFRRARQYAPAIIFIDEIDAIGKERTGSDMTHYTEDMLNALLTEMDGFTVDVDNPVFVLAATNYGMNGGSGIQRKLDEALLRRFDNQIMVDLPNKAEREQYIRLLLKKIKNNTVTEDVINNIASRTTGKSPAIIQNIMDLAFRNSVKKKEPLSDEILLESFEEFSYGERHKHEQAYYESVAVHESGHAVASYLAGIMPSYVTIVSRSDFGGYMMPGEQEDKPNYTREELLWKVRIALAGRAAEKVFFGEAKAINTGASSDLQQATSYVFQMLASFGMGENKLISLPFDKIMGSVMAKEYFDEANSILAREMAETEKLMTENKALVEKLSQALLVNNDLTSAQIEAVLKE